MDVDAVINNNNNNTLPPPTTPKNDGDDVNNIPECQFSMGDHVYHWCSVAFIPGIYQHHGIVLDVYYDDDEKEWALKIVDFSNERNNEKKKKKRLFHQQSSSSSSSTNKGVVRTYVSSEKEWSAVQYSATVWQRATWRAGTCTAVRTDPPGLVRARAQHLLEHPDVLPPYDTISANCECFAVWCKTGTFATLQTSSWLAMTSAGQIKSAVTVGSVAAATQVTVPSAGLWGWLGYTTHVSLLTAQPMLLPAIATYGVVTAGVPAIVLAMAKQHWKTTTVTLNETFWEHAVAQPEVFVECITYWSTVEDDSIIRTHTSSESRTIITQQEEPVASTSDDGGQAISMKPSRSSDETEVAHDDDPTSANNAIGAVEKNCQQQRPLNVGQQSSGQTSSEPRNDP